MIMKKTLGHILIGSKYKREIWPRRKELKEGTNHILKKGSKDKEMRRKNKRIIRKSNKYF